MKTKDTLPDYDFSKGVRGKYARNYAKASFERPNTWHVIVTLFAMIYLSGFNSSFLSLLLSRDPESIVVGIVVALVWCYLILDLIKQISRFKSPFRK